MPSRLAGSMSGATLSSVGVKAFSACSISRVRHPENTSISGCKGHRCRSSVSRSRWRLPAQHAVVSHNLTCPLWALFQKPSIDGDDPTKHCRKLRALTFLCVISSLRPLIVRMQLSFLSMTVTAVEASPLPSKQDPTTQVFHLPP